VEKKAEERTLSQIQAKKCADKYRSLNRPIYLIGIEFSKKTRDVAGFAMEKMEVTATN
jgi:hypothetical protein